MKTSAAIVPPPTNMNQQALFETDESSVRQQALYTLIARQPFFEGLEPAHFKLLADSASEMRFEPGQAIFDEGSPANRFFLILEGKVVMESDAKEHGRIAIQTLGPGDTLGWSWLFPPYSLHISARAIEPTRAISFFGVRLREQCEQDHELGYQLMKRIAGVATQCVRALQQRLMECSDPDKLQQ